MLNLSNTEIVVAPIPDFQDLLLQKSALALVQNIPSMSDHIDAWLQLAIDFAAIGLPGAASECIARVVEYGQLAPGEYVRLIERPVAELIHVPSERL